MSAHVETVVEDWERDIAVLACEESALRAEGSWARGPTDLLTVIGRRRIEATHSDALRWLLDPIGAHGLGVAPLVGLCDMLDIDAPDEVVLSRCDVSREVFHDGTIADLVVDGPAVRIVFEVKVDAVEQPDQCARLVQHFDMPDEVRFVFLTLHGGRPSTAGPTLDRWSCIAWRQVLGMLEVVRSRHEPARAAAAAVDAYLASLGRIA